MATTGTHIITIKRVSEIFTNFLHLIIYRYGKLAPSVYGNSYEIALPQASARFETIQKQLAASKEIMDETPYYTERQPYTKAPALPMPNRESIVIKDDVDGRNHYYSTLDEVYYKRVV